MKKLKPKHFSESTVEMNNIVLWSHANSLGTIFGGVLMSWIDIAAAICAQRHSKKIVVTASVDALYFLAPARVGDTVTLKAKVVYTGRTSIVVLVEVATENPLEGIPQRCVTATLSLVALDHLKKPTPVPPLLLKTKAEREENIRAAKRRAILLEAIKTRGPSL